MKRYSMQVWRDGDLEHVEDPNGEWVRWEEVEDLQKKIDFLLFYNNDDIITETDLERHMKEKGW